MRDDSFLSVSTTFFERKTTSIIQEYKQNENDRDRDTGFWVGLHREGAWESIRSLLPLSTVPVKLQDHVMAMEVIMQKGQKHVIFRGLVKLANESDISMDISVCSVSSSHNQVLSLELSPGSSTILPWRCTSKDFDYCLQVRPNSSHLEPDLRWSYAVAIGPIFPSPNEDSHSRQSTENQRNKSPSSAFMLNQLENHDILLCSSSSTNEKFWLTAGIDASVLHTEMNAPIYDWKISVNSPMKLENRLPCPVEFTIWETTDEGEKVDRQHGIISSRETANVHSADIQRPLYLTFSAQDRWVLEKVRKKSEKSTR